MLRRRWQTNFTENKIHPMSSMTTFIKGTDRPPPRLLYLFFKVPRRSVAFSICQSRGQRDIRGDCPDELIENEQALTKRSIREERRAC
jgi:hypothetical protein